MFSYHLTQTKRCWCLLWVDSRFNWVNASVKFISWSYENYFSVNHNASLYHNIKTNSCHRRIQRNGASPLISKGTSCMISTIRNLKLSQQSWAPIFSLEKDSNVFPFFHSTVHTHQYLWHMLFGSQQGNVKSSCCFFISIV